MHQQILVHRDSPSACRKKHRCKGARATVVRFDARQSPTLRRGISLRASMRDRMVKMGRVALVTGGTRGIGAAISRTLKAKGYAVAATYAGNTKAAETFAAETGIHIHQWDIGDFD